MIENSGLRHFKAYRPSVKEMMSPQHYGQRDAHFRFHHPLLLLWFRHYTALYIAIAATYSGYTIAFELILHMFFSLISVVSRKG